MCFVNGGGSELQKRFYQLSFPLINTLQIEKFDFLMKFPPKNSPRTT